MSLQLSERNDKLMQASLPLKNNYSLMKPPRAYHSQTEMNIIVLASLPIKINIYSNEKLILYLVS